MGVVHFSPSAGPRGCVTLLVALMISFDLLVFGGMINVAVNIIEIYGSYYFYEKIIYIIHYDSE
jgi:hypothetical protein